MKWWFWDTPKEGENWAQTLVRVFGNLIRGAISLVVFLIALGTGIWTWNYFSPESQLRRGLADAEKSLGLHVYFDNEVCSSEFPLVVVVQNTSDFALIEAEIQLTARQPGRSSNKLNRGRRNISWDKVVLPKKTEIRCYKPYDLPSEQIDPNWVWDAEFVSWGTRMGPVERWMRPSEGDVD